MQLQELLNTPVQVKIIQKDNANFITRLSFPYYDIEFRAERWGGKNPTKWDIVFGVEDDDSSEMVLNTDLTGKGDQLKVMSFVKNQIHELIKFANPSEIEFTADSDTRASVYTRLFRGLDDYTVERYPDGKGWKLIVKRNTNDTRSNPAQGRMEKP